MSAKLIALAAGILIGAISAIFIQRRIEYTERPHAPTRDTPRARNIMIHTDQQCPICLEQMNTKNGNCSILPCGHILHYKCLEKLSASARSKTCPTCREPF